MSIDGSMPLLSNPNVESYVLEETTAPLPTAFACRHMGRDPAAALPSGGFRALQASELPGNFSQINPNRELRKGLRLALLR